MLTKKIILLLFIFASISLYSQFSGGTGTVIDPYQIATKTDLKTLCDNSIHWDKHFIQTADLMFTSADYLPAGDFYYGGSFFSPIGNNASLFIGSYNGQNFVIDSLKINRPTLYNVGLFGIVFNSNIINLGLTHVDIIGFIYVGGLTGSSHNSSITNSYVNGSVSGNYSVGGLVGDNLFGAISNTYSTGNVLGESNAGGLIGLNDNSSLITNSFSNVNVSGNNYIGGLVGINNESSTILNSYCTGSVTGNYFVGGLVGNNSNNSIISNTYCTGNVTGTLNVGGLVGIEYASTVSKSFWNIETTGYITSSGGTGKSTIEMQTQSTFTDSTWDFVLEIVNGTEDIWKMGNCATNNNYPIFSWQTLMPLPTPTISAATNTTFCDGGSVVIISTQGDNYLWNTGATTSTITLSNSDTVFVQIESNDGCLSDTSNMIIVSEIDCSSIEEESNLVSIYPNPTSNFITIQTNEEIKSIQLIDMMGKVVAIFKNLTTIDISTLLNGMYTIEIVTENKMYQKKVVKM